MVTVMVDRLDAEDGHIDMSFPYFVTKLTPVSGMPSTLDSPPIHESVRTPSSQKTSSRSTTARPTPASTSTRTPRALVGPVGIEPTTERL